MASLFNSIAALITDDSGTPDAPVGDGTQINSSLFAAIDAILNEFVTRSAKTVGGQWTWETFGQHKMEASGTGLQSLLIHNLSSGTANKATLVCQVDGVSVAALEKFASNHTVNGSGSITADGARLVSNGTGLFSLETVAASGFKLFPGGGLRATFDFANGAVAENQFGWNVKNTAGTVIPGVVISGANVMNIGSASAAGMNDTAINGGTAVRFNINSAERAVIDDTRPELRLGGVASGVLQSLELGSGSGSPISGQILFGTDGSGWQLRLGKNQGGSVTTFWKLTDSGHLSPVTNNVYDFGTSTERVKAIYATDINMTGSCSPNADNATALGDATHRYASFYAVDANFGDASFDNGWCITEGEKVGLGPGLAFIDADNDLQFFVSGKGYVYAKQFYPIHSIRDGYRRMTKQERLRG